VGANTLDVTNKDDGQFDLNNTPGVIEDSIVVATNISGGIVQPIPTLSVWGLLLLIGLISLFGIQLFPNR
jgi:hypothetical protein